MKSDIEIAQEARMKPIAEIAASLGLADEDVIPYGTLQGQDRPPPHRHKRWQARRQAGPGHRHQPHPGGRGQDHHQRGPGRRHARAGQEGHALPA